MKKAIKGLIIAASVASVIGIGAVSFAAWQAGDAKEVEVKGSTGSINTVGDLTVTPASASGSVDTTGGDPVYTMNALMPVDQGSGVTYWEFTVTVDGEGSQTIKLAGEIAKGDDGTAVGSAALYWSNTTPTSADATSPDSTKKLSSTAIEITPDSNDKVYVYMVAGGTDAMKADITLTFSADATAVSGD